MGGMTAMKKAKKKKKSEFKLDLNEVKRLEHKSKKECYYFF